MHSVLVRSYRYKYGRDGIIPGTWYLEFLLEPCSVSLERSKIARVDYDIVTVSGRVLLKRDQDGEVHGYGNTGELRVFTLDDDKEITERERTRYTEKFQMIPCLNIINIRRYCTVIIDGTEYNNQYVQDHLDDLRILLDQIRTDTLLEELDG